ncbi:MAG: hypothetical protein FJ161_00895 [Gammaproteobacteria bacterium]|nr:hypothetical protein [Gammaproteobacteria bacterium]
MKKINIQKTKLLCGGEIVNQGQKDFYYHIHTNNGIPIRRNESGTSYLINDDAVVYVSDNPGCAYGSWFSAPTRVFNGSKESDFATEYASDSFGAAAAVTIASILGLGLGLTLAGQ